MADRAELRELFPWTASRAVKRHAGRERGVFKEMIVRARDLVAAGRERSRLAEGTPTAGLLAEPIATCGLRRAASGTFPATWPQRGWLG